MHKPRITRIEWSRPAYSRFLSLSPSAQDLATIKIALLTLKNDPSLGIKVPFQQYRDAFFIDAGGWRIVYTLTEKPVTGDDPEIVAYVVHVDNKMVY